MTRTNLASIKGLIIITLFAVSMGYLESAVVVYLRHIYYPEGFAFPLKNMDLHIAVTELFREAATLIMLIAIGLMAGRTKTGKFGVFIFAFGIWDIFYYIFLKIILDWPESLLTWDILFLMPSTWTGPVLAPVINSLSMILLGGMLYYSDLKDRPAGIRRGEWMLLTGGSLVILWAYMEDYLRFLHREFSWPEIFSPKYTGRIMEHAAQYVPEDFSWVVFCAGQMIILVAIGIWFLRYCKLKKG